MIKLTEDIELLGQTEAEYTPIYVPADVVVRVWSGKTIVDYHGQSHTVIETPEEVVQKIMDYKIGMTQYQIYLSDDTRRKHWDRCKSSAALLKRIAGLTD